LTLFEAYIVQHQLAERTFDLQSRCVYLLPPELAREWERIDSLRVQGMLYGERQCRKLKTGSFPWSPEIQNCIDVITVWQLVCKRRKGLRVSTGLLRRSASAAGLPDAVRQPLETATVALAEAYRKYKVFKRQASAYRQTWLEGLAAALAAQGNTKASTHLENLQRRERQRQTPRQIRRATGKQ
jgi:hypothetical protein